MISLKRFLTVSFGLFANAATIKITAGGTGLYFQPETTTAAKGDILKFHFVPRNHSVVAGDFNNPCQPAATGGFFSGFVPVSTGEPVSFYDADIFTNNFFLAHRTRGSL
jgi:plastocyanin